MFQLILNIRENFFFADIIIVMLSVNRKPSICQSINQKSRMYKVHFYLRQGGNVFARLCLFVCLFVCVPARLLKKLRMDLCEICWECREWQKLPVIQFWGWSRKNPGFWITLKFSLTLLSMGHKGNRCQTEYGAGTWRTTWRWIKVFQVT